MLQKILVQLFQRLLDEKILQIQPWIDNKEASYIKKIVSKTYLRGSKYLVMVNSGSSANLLAMTLLAAKN